MVEYDSIAKEYSSVQVKRLGRHYIYDPSLFNQLNDLEEKSVLDLGCGDGYLTRQIKQLGAKSIHGVDLSKKMIDIAKQKETELNQGISYSVGRVGKLGKVGKFDVVVMGLMLHYAKTENELYKMCLDAFLNLKKGGRLVSLNNSPEHPLIKSKKLGSMVETKGKLRNGSKLKVTLFDNGKKACSFHNYHWEKEVYERCLKKAGFFKIKWIPLELSKEGKEKYGENFFEDFFNQPYLILIEARKK